MKASRIEKDSLGACEIPGGAYYGIHTQRALENFPANGIPVHRGLIGALARVKKACALANGELGYLEKEKADAIARACDEIVRTALIPSFGYGGVESLIGEYRLSAEKNVRAFLEKKLGKDRVDRVLSPFELVKLGFRHGTDTEG